MHVGISKQKVKIQEYLGEIKMVTTVERLSPTTQESLHIRGLLNEIMNNDALRLQESFLENSIIYAQELPRRIREIFYQFKHNESSSVLLVTKNPVLLDGPGPTPNRHIEMDHDYKLNDAQILHGLYGSLLGEAIGFTSQRGGSVYNNLMPLSNYSSISNSSSGSKLDFGFHVEDAFHPARADYLGLVCLRNDENAATTISSIDGIQLTDKEKEVLFQPNFYISHNPIHTTNNVINEEGQPILFGHPDHPYIRINIASMNLDRYQGIERIALEKIITHFEKNVTAVVLASRDCIFIDNYRCVHGRNAFDASYGENARWLSRVVFTNDLRKSSAIRHSCSSRQIAA